MRVKIIITIVVGGQCSFRRFILNLRRCFNLFQILLMDFHKSNKIIYKGIIMENMDLVELRKNRTIGGTGYENFADFFFIGITKSIVLINRN
jgi:hypothetical protein